MDHESPTAGEVRGGVLEARNLCVLRDEVEDRVEHEVHDRELAVDAGGGEVTDRDLDIRRGGLLAQAGDHVHGVVDPDDGNAALGEGNGDPAGADPELERPAVA